MKSRASFKSHPIHPMLIVYPFAFLTGAFAFTAAATVTKKRELRDVASHLLPAGIAAGLTAAVPGVIDYVTVVPPRSSGKERATKHALLNTTALGFFAASWLLERNRRRPAVSLLLQALGSTAMSVAGFLGGTLVYRNQIAVDHRYANAGRWTEETRAHAGTRALTSAAAPLDVDQMKLVHIDGTRIVVGRSETGYAAFQDRCTHKGGPLSDGVLMCGTVQCPWHGSQFDVHTGAVKCGPATEHITTYAIEEAHRITPA
jgi:nitrite reductase/ring-hydroxylating ferredoxin subunit/uncharacterized membrane protein